VNGDGLADMLVGATQSLVSGQKVGRSYVVFGKSTGSAIDLAAIAAIGAGANSLGFAINGEKIDDSSGYSVSAAGDVNGDGLLDIVGTRDGSIIISRGNADGTFVTGDTNDASSFEGGNSRVVIGDFNRDGVLDIISTTGTKIGFQLGNATTTTTAQYVTLTSQADARTALTTLEGLAQRIASERGRIGATQSRLGTAANVLQSARENFIAAASRITDADMGLESSELIRQQILQQSSAAVLAQANQEPSLVLKLLAA
jgi:flagellin-like hook-associated protein FlgL